ncbi:MAG: FAD-dependent oxidoreductase [Rubrivivax sp.]
MALARLREPRVWDLVVVGGGATGLGVALDAASRGLEVLLLEATDFAQGTSSRATKLVHGGVRYLAQGRIAMVRQALRERALVLGLAPHLAQPLPFVVAENNPLRWALTLLGLKLYQVLAGRMSLGKTQAIGSQAMRRLLPTLPSAFAGVRYWDGQFDDARLALALAQTARAAGAELRNHTRVTGLGNDGQAWQIELQDELSGARATLQAPCVVNAAVVWVDEVRRQVHQGGQPLSPRPLVRPSQGVQLVVSRQTLPLREAVLVPRTRDGRVLFAVPWLGATVIGTTDTPRGDAPLEPRPLEAELLFLLQETQRALGVQLAPEQVLSVWVGLRPLVEAGSAGAESTAALSREHLIVREAQGLLTVTGGKWTTYRAMAQEVMAALVVAGDLPAAARQAQTGQHRLWGAPHLSAVSLQEPPGPHLLGSVELDTAPDDRLPLGMGLTQAMVRHSARHEWAVTVEDMLARRWRALFLDARAAKAMAPQVARLLEHETGIDPQLPQFLALCDQYTMDPRDTLDSLKSRSAAAAKAAVASNPRHTEKTS